MGRKKTISDAELLGTARQVFVEKGLAAPTKEIARRAGVSEGVLFQRYPTKAGLFFAAMVVPVADLAGLLRPRRSNGLSHLREITRAMLEYFRATLPVLLPLMTHPGFRFESFAAAHPGSPLDALRRGLVTYLAEERKAGRIGAVDPGAAALMILALAECIAFFEHMGAHHGRFPPELLDRAVDGLWWGLAPARPAQRSARFRPK